MIWSIVSTIVLPRCVDGKDCYKVYYVMDNGCVVPAEWDNEFICPEECENSNPSLDPELACFTNDWGDTIVKGWIEFDTSVSPAVPTFYDYMSNVLTGYEPTTCQGKNLESDPKIMCDDGVEFLRRFVKENGEPNGDYFDTDLSNAAYTPTGTVTRWPCNTCQPKIGSFVADDITNVFPFTKIDVVKPSCCSVTLKTTAGDIVLWPQIKVWGTEFKCPIELTEIVSDCADLTKIDIILQKD